MKTIDDLLDDILPLALFGVLDPEYISGRKTDSSFGLAEPEENREKDEDW